MSNSPTPTAQDGERERLIADMTTLIPVGARSVATRIAKMIRTQSAELAALRAQVEGLRDANDSLRGRLVCAQIAWDVFKASKASDGDHAELYKAMQRNISDAELAALRDEVESLRARLSEYLPDDRHSIMEDDAPPQPVAKETKP